MTNVELTGRAHRMVDQGNGAHQIFHSNESITNTLPDRVSMKNQSLTNHRKLFQENIRQQNVIGTRRSPLYLQQHAVTSLDSIRT